MDSRPKGNRNGGYGMVLESLSSMNRFEKMKTKEEFHLLIDSIEDENLLRAYYELVRMLNLQEEGKLMQSLSADQKSELMRSYEESYDEGQLLNHEEMKRRNSKWL